MAPKKTLPREPEPGNAAAQAPSRELQALIDAHLRRVADSRAIEYGTATDALDRIEAWCALARAEIATGGGSPFIELAARVNALLANVPIGGTSETWLAIMDCIFNASDALMPAGADEMAVDLAYNLGTQYADRIAPELAERLRSKCAAAREAISTYRTGARSAAATALSDVVGYKSKNNDQWKKLQGWRSRRAQRSNP